MSVLVEVTQEDIDRGIAESCSLCPVALALYRRTRRRWHVWRSEVCLAGKGQPVKSPESVRTFIQKFDDDRPVAPFSFWFPTVPHYAKEKA